MRYFTYPQDQGKIRLTKTSNRQNDPWIGRSHCSHLFAYSNKRHFTDLLSTRYTRWIIFDEANDANVTLIILECCKPKLFLGVLFLIQHDNTFLFGTRARKFVKISDSGIDGILEMHTTKVCHLDILMCADFVYCISKCRWLLELYCKTGVVLPGNI